MRSPLSSVSISKVLFTAPYFMLDQIEPNPINP